MMKLNEDNQPYKELNQNLFMVSAKQNCTNFESLINYLNHHQYEVESALRNYGGLVIRGYKVKTPEQFQQVGLSIFPNLQNQYPGGAPRHKVAEYVWTASAVPSYLSIAGHTELSYSPSDQPAHILFFSPQVATSGGETPVINMKSVLSDLPEDLQEKFSENNLITKFFWVSMEKKLFDVRLWEWGKFRYPKSWKTVFNTEDKGLVETKCFDAGGQTEWLTDDNLIVSCAMPITSSHPITKETVWTGWFPWFHIWGICIDAWFVANYQRQFRNWLVFLILFLITFGQICLEKLIRNNYKYRVLDVAFEDGSNLSFWDVYSIVKSYWKNTELFSWQEGDIIILDNYSIGHGRLSFTGERKVYVAFG
ncbi:TauD/TfdA family dioxygenase [Okeania sp.]|uniref:TauD/TfdA family dioxygenase n=1 Tax=Okeania sp. TaxID=3100323 RepID=UPI002B4AC9E1|nr:TauD/TfdA family dioxygenase [Okeania sp.]MEB3343311.1 TauD/TfdA family dioxygenase [Okeania sp.]